MKAQNKFTIDDAQKYASQFGGLCIGGVYKNIKSKLEWKCKYGHNFIASLGSLKQRFAWCKYCSGRFNSEELCRVAFEQMFDEPFPSIYPKWLTGISTRRLELDGYCEKLGIAFEHNGDQHNKNIPYFYNKNIIINDQIKKEICNNRGIKLIIIPQLHKYIKLNDLAGFIKCELSKYNITPKCYNVDYTKILSSNYRERKLQAAQKLAETNGGECLSDKYINVKIHLLWKCMYGHKWEATVDHIKNGTWCPKCYYNSISNRFILDEQHILNMYRDGATITDISREIRASKHRLSKILRSNNIYVKGGTRNFNYDTLYDFYIVQKFSARKIGRLLCADHKTIIRHLDIFNIRQI